MKLLVLLPSVPDPPDSGARLRNRGLLRLLAAEHDVDALAFGPPDAQVRLERLVRRGGVVPEPRPRSAVRRLGDTARSDLPDMAQRCWSPAFARALEDRLERDEYDLVQAEGIEMARSLGCVPPERRVYDAHNPEFLLQRRACQAGSGLLASVYSRLQWRRLERFERAVVRTSALTLAVSQHDANQLLALAGPAARVHVVPNGIDVASFAFRADPPDGEDLLFMGTLGYRPNAEAVRWLVQQVLPRLHRLRPRARLFMVGKQPPGWLVRAGQHDPRIAVTGYVADERAYLERCAALLLPVRVAGGSRLKALVAMASGVPIVSTRLGMEGLEVEPQHHFVPAESAEEWAASIAGLLDDRKQRQELATAARRLVEARYDWAVLAGAVRAAYGCGRR